MYCTPSNIHFIQTVFEIHWVISPVLESMDYKLIWGFVAAWSKHIYRHETGILDKKLRVDCTAIYERMSGLNHNHIVSASFPGKLNDCSGPPVVQIFLNTLLFLLPQQKPYVTYRSDQSTRKHNRNGSCFLAAFLALIHSISQVLLRTCG